MSLFVGTLFGIRAKERISHLYLTKIKAKLFFLFQVEL